MLELSNVSKHYSVGDFIASKSLTALDRVSLKIEKGEFFSIVGESGCGKSTLARIVCGLDDRSSGEMSIGGQAIGGKKDFRNRDLRRKVQMVFQDPYSSLNPRMRVRDVLRETLASLGWGDRAAIEHRIQELASIIRFPDEALDRFPHQFSGGQRQRIAIARALAANPELLICDEPVSALDVSIKGQIVNLLLDIQESLGITILFISHDLSLVEKISDRVGVMYLGELVEVGTAREIFDDPRHPYSRLLIDSIPSGDPNVRRNGILAAGEIPSPFSIPSGCRFRDRCPLAFERCATEEPVLREYKPGAAHKVACNLGSQAVLRPQVAKRERPAGLTLFSTP